MENQSIDVTNENTEYEQEELETLYNLERLLESGQFELVSDKPENGKIREKRARTSLAQKKTGTKYYF